MNRSILIIICDFLLLSLLTFSTDLSRIADEESPRTVTTEEKTDPQTALLTKERLARQQAQVELAKIRAEADQRTKTSEEQVRQLEERNRQAEAVQAQVESLRQELHASAAEASTAKEKLAAMQEEADTWTEKMSVWQQRFAQVTKSNKVFQAEKQQLTAKLRAAETDKRKALAQLTTELKAEQAEAAKHAEQINELTRGSGSTGTGGNQPATPQAPSTIFNNFVTSRLQASFTATKFGLPTTTRHRETEAILVTDGSHYYALCHLKDTPLTLSEPIIEWDKLFGTLEYNKTLFQVQLLDFHLEDPRVVLAPLTEIEAHSLSCKIYQVTSDAAKFEDAVLIGARDNYYAECKLEVDPTTPNYLKLDRESVKSLFRKANPSSGDLVFSKTGELVGLMANDNYCLPLQRFDFGLKLRLGDNMAAQHTDILLSELREQVMQLPQKLK